MLLHFCVNLATMDERVTHNRDHGSPGGRSMRIAVLGGGPGGLFAATLAKTGLTRT